MKRKQHDLIFKCLIFGLLLFLIPSCSKKETEPDSIRNQNENRQPSPPIDQMQENETERVSWPGSDLPSIYYSKLEYQTFTDILNDNIAISDIHLVYNDDSAVLPNGDLLEYKDLILYGGYSWKSLKYSDINTFEGSYEHFIEGVTPQDVESLIHNFTRDELNILFNYMKEGDNPAYFFNGAELEGKPDPYETKSRLLCQGKYIFVLRFGKPDDSHNAWGICKCCDDPSTDPVFRELITVIEDNFISHF